MPPKTRTPKPPAKRAATKKTAASPTKRAPGRPRKLEIDPDLLERILEMVRTGAYPERAAVAAGISERTHYLWQAKGLEERDHREGGKPPRKTMQIFLEYIDAMDKAIADAEIKLLKKAAEGGSAGTASMTILERRFRDRWGSKPIATTSTAKPTPTATTPLGQLEERRRAREQASR